MIGVLSLMKKHQTSEYGSVREKVSFYHKRYFQLYNKKADINYLLFLREKNIKKISKFLDILKNLPEAQPVSLHYISKIAGVPILDVEHYLTEIIVVSYRYRCGDGLCHLIEIILMQKYWGL